MKYGKLENGYFKEYFFIQNESKCIYSPEENVWFENGYKKLNVGDRPVDLDGFIIQELYEVVGDEVIMSYSQLSIPIREGLPL